MKLTAYWPYLLALLLGALTVAAFAPMQLFWLPLITLSPLFYLWSRSPGWRSGALLGWSFGLGLFGAGVSWVYISLQVYGGMPVAVAVSATVLFAAFLALFPALVGFLQSFFITPNQRLLALPALWVLVEWLRDWIFTGFPWLALGYSQVPFSPLAGYAPVFGVFGVSLVLLAGVSLVALARWPGLLAVLLLWVGGWALQQVQWTQPQGEAFTVSLTQGNIEQGLKWDPQRLYNSLDNYAELVRQSSGKLIVLPETALPMFYHDVPPEYVAFLAQQAKKNKGDLLVGLADSDPDSGRYYNSIVSLGSAPSQFYRKVHLVPFGEYVALPWLFQPLLQYLHIPMSDFSSGSVSQKPLQVAGQQVAVSICYEDVFGEEVIRQLPQATVLVNVSDDTWFGDSLAPEQHLQIAQTRALETGRYLLRSTNTGVTAIIDQQGRVLDRLPTFVPGVLNGLAQGYRGGTPYVYWGNVAAILLAVLSMLPAVWSVVRERRLSSGV